MNDMVFLLILTENCVFNFLFSGKIVQLYHVVTIRSDYLYGVLVLGRFYPRIWNGMCSLLA